MSWGRQCLDIFGLLDLGFERFPHTKVTHLSRHGSNHVAITIDLDADLGEVKKKHVFIYRFEEIRIKDERCEGLVRQLWNGNGVQGYQKFCSMKGLDEHFKEYMIGYVSKELGRIEGLLKEEVRWSTSDTDMIYKALKAQHNKLL
ncbi:unnamed protein product [Lathyrus sativus]|nr:unnamed protein product [Lathyrus sativus]